MPFALPKIAGTAFLALISTALVVPLTALPASATSVVERAFAVEDTDLDGKYGLYVRSAVSGTSTPVVPESAAVDVEELATNLTNAGDRAVFIQRTYSGTTPVREQVVVADVSGHVVRVLEDIPASDTVYDTIPNISPDGTMAMWTRVSVTATTFSVETRSAPVAAGASSTLLAGLGGTTYLSDACAIGQDLSGTWFLRPTTKDTTTAHCISVDDLNIPADAGDITFYNSTGDPSNMLMAWSLDTSTASATQSDIQFTHYGFDGINPPVFGTPTTVASGGNNVAPSFTVYGAGTIYYLHDDGLGGTGQLYAVPTNNSTAPAAVNGGTNGDELDFGIAQSFEGTDPAAPAMHPAVLNGTSAVLSWATPTSGSEPSGVVISRPGKTVVINAPATGYTDTGLTIGTTYAYTLTAFDRAGHQSSPVTQQLTALLPAPAFADPTSTTSAKTAFPVTFAATTAATSAKYTVDYLVIGTTTWKHWVVGVTGRVRTFGTASTTGVLATTSTPGTNYVFRVQIKDAYGNASAFITSGRAVVPFDQSRAVLSGGATLASSASFLGSIRQLKTTASYAKVTLTGSRLQIIGIKCVSCGKFAVYDGNTKIATIDTYGTSTKLRQVLYTRTYTTSATHTYTIRPLATAGRPAVDLDGFAMRR